MPVIEDVIIWSNEPLDKLDPPKYSNAEIADFMEGRKYDIIQSVLCLFEGVPMPVEAVREITRSDGKIGREAAAFGNGLELLTRMVREGNFEFSRETYQKLHALVSEPKLPPDRRGVFRSSQTCWHGILHTAPAPEDLDRHWEEGSKAILAVEKPLDRAIAAFAWLMRMQFFGKSNKRTALLMSYGLMAQAGYKPFLLPIEVAAAFSSQLTLILETGGADMFFKLIKATIYREAA